MMRVYQLDSVVVQVTGNAEKFLNGLTSNSLDAPHNAFLNLHGRIIATFDQLKTGADEFMLVFAAPFWEAAKVHTDKYARLSKTTLEPTSLKVYFDLDGDAPLEAGDHVIPQKAGRLVLTARNLPQTISAGEFTQFRLKYQLPVQGIDYRDEMVLNVHEHDFVSYTKGCFLGQEPVAKVHHRSKPTWKLVVRFTDELSAELRAKITSKAVDPASGRERGFVFVPNN